MDLVVVAGLSSSIGKGTVVTINAFFLPKEHGVLEDKESL